MMNTLAYSVYVCRICKRDFMSTELANIFCLSCLIKEREHQEAINRCSFRLDPALISAQIECDFWERMFENASNCYLQVGYLTKRNIAIHERDSLVDPSHCALCESGQPFFNNHGKEIIPRKTR